MFDLSTLSSYIIAFATSGSFWVPKILHTMPMGTVLASELQRISKRVRAKTNTTRVCLL